MKFKLDVSKIDFSDVVDHLNSRFKVAMGAMLGQIKSEAQNIAASKLKSGLKHWERGFKINKVTDDLFIIAVEGKLANWMEDGFTEAEYKKAMLSGPAAKTGKNGNKYVDIPIAKNADDMGNISLGKQKEPKINISAFANADQMVKAINSYTFKGKEKKNVVQSRVQDIIKNVQANKAEGIKTSYLTIRRLSQKSSWPKSAFQGAKVIDKLDSFIDANIDSILERYL